MRAGHLRSWVNETDVPGAMTVAAQGSADVAASVGEYLTLKPMKSGLAPLSLVMMNASVGRVSRMLLGSLRSLTVSSPVLVRVVTTFRFSTLSTVAGPVTLTDRPGVAATEAAAAMATRATRVARREVENMVLTVEER